MASIAFRCTDELNELLEEKADEWGFTKSALIVDALEQYLGVEGELSLAEIVEQHTAEIAELKKMIESLGGSTRKAIEQPQPEAEQPKIEEPIIDHPISKEYLSIQEFLQDYGHYNLGINGNSPAEKVDKALADTGLDERFEYRKRKFYFKN